MPSATRPPGRGSLGTWPRRGDSRPQGRDDLVVLDLRGLSEATDFFVIASGTSDAHVRGIAESVMEKLDRRGHRTHHVEGLNGGRWVLLDFVDFVVHLFHPETRSFYQLERLWDDAPELLISST